MTYAEKGAIKKLKSIFQDLRIEIKNLKKINEATQSSAYALGFQLDPHTGELKPINPKKQ